MFCRFARVWGEPLPEAAVDVLLTLRAIIRAHAVDVIGPPLSSPASMKGRRARQQRTDARDEGVGIHVNVKAAMVKTLHLSLKQYTERPKYY